MHIETRNIDKSDVQLAMSLSSLHFALTAQERLDVQVTTLRRELESAKTNEDQLEEDKNSGEKYPIARQKTRELTDELRELEARAEHAVADVRDARVVVKSFGDVGEELAAR